MVGIEAEEQELIKEIEARDRKDSTRDISPLRKAADAIELDTSNLTIEEQVDFIVTRAKKMIHQNEQVL
jgi:cytidylate kinase